MVRAIQFDRFGGPEVLEYREVGLGEPGAGQARVKHTAVGVNFIDVYHRTGLYPLALPSGLGSEAAGVVVATGAGVTHVKPGDRVAYNAAGSLGSYSEERLVDARWLVKLPRAIDDRAGAAMMLKGLTAWYLLNRSYRSQRGDSILLYAAAGGVGLIAAQWARHLGAHVIGIVSTEEKRALAIEHGCEHVLLASDDIRARVRALTDGAACRSCTTRSAATRSFNRSTAADAWASVSFGNASGPVRAVLAPRAHEARVSLRHATHARRLHPRASRSRDRLRGAVRARRARRDQDRGQSDLRARGRGVRAPRSRGAAHNASTVLLP